MSRAEIVAAASEMLRVHGYEQVSMRRVASACGVGVTTLYWHVDGKEELLDLVCDEALADLVDGLPRRGTWQKRLRHALSGLRVALLSHGDLAVKFAARPNVGPNALRLREYLAGCLSESGLTPTQIRSVDRALLSYTTGACCAEVAATDVAGQQDLTPRQVEAAVGSFLARLSAEDFPELVRLGTESRFVERERDFLAGLDCFLAGITATYG